MTELKCCRKCGETKENHEPVFALNMTILCCRVDYRRKKRKKL